MKTFFLLSLIFSFALTLPATAAVLTNICDVAGVLVDERHAVGDRFDLCGQVMRINDGPYRSIILGDGGASTILHFDAKDATFPTLVPGDFIHATGQTTKDHRDMNATHCENVSILRHGQIPPPRQATSDDILSGKADFQNIALRGTVNDAFRDDIDDRYAFLIVNNGNDGVLVTLPATSLSDEDIRSFIDAEVSVTGFCDPQPQTSRRRARRLLATSSQSDIRIIRRANSDPYAAPDIQRLALERPSRVISSGRHKVSGRVLAVWQGDTFLVKTAFGELCRVQLANQSPPAFGTSVEAVGYPETDLYRVNLSRAVWRKSDDQPLPSSEPERVHAHDIVNTANGKTTYDTLRYGSVIHLSGIVRSTPTTNGGNGLFYLEADQQVLCIDASACPDALTGVSLGARIDATGVCIFDTQSWRGNAFPRIAGFRLVVRTPEDIAILSRPSWWTTGRLFTVIGCLLVILAGALAWNLILRHIARLRLADRTRLAIELHDSMSQNLSSISLQIDAARELINTDLSRANHRLEIASKTIDSCRNELKNCICDLRNDALDTPDFATAIRKTLQPGLGGCTLNVRVNVPRNLLTDNTAHALLCVIRELATNAVRHGKAKCINVVGLVDHGSLRLSVTDNGTGFNVDNRPSVDEGHFGLQGVIERVRSIGGQMQITSRIGTGTRAAITITNLTEQK